MPSKTPARLLAIAIVLATLLGTGLAASWISGCAALQPDPAGWYAEPTHKPLPPVYREKSQEELRRLCGGGYSGCAWSDYSTGLCWIFTEPNPPAWLRAHEEKHCAGFDHAPWGRQIVVTFWGCP